MCGVWSIVRGVMCKTSECVWSMEYCEGYDVCERQVSVCGVWSIVRGVMCV